MHADGYAPSPAEVKDRHAKLAAFGLLSLGAKYAVDAVAHFVDPAVARSLDYVGVALALGAVLMVIPMVYYKWRRLDPAGRRAFLSDDGFTANTFKKAQLFSWSASMVVLVLFEVASDDLTGVPGRFYLQAALAVMLITFSVSFLILDRDPGGDGAHA